MSSRMNKRAEVLGAVSRNTLSVAEAAQQLGVAPERVQAWLEAWEVAHEVAAQQNRRWLRRGAQALGALALLGLARLATSEAWAAGCTAILPAPMVTLCANEPAVASHVNGNFKQTVDWLTQKVGAPGTPLVTVGSAGAIEFGSTTRQGIDLWNTPGKHEYGLGVQSSTEYFRTDGAFAWYRGGVHSDAAQTPGAGGTTYALLDADGFKVGGHRTPSVVKAAHCPTANDCTVTCPAGMTVKMAFGFHGYSSAVNSGASWACGAAWQWLGTCIGAGTCSVSTGCGGMGGSSVWAECW